MRERDITDGTAVIADGDPLFTVGLAKALLSTAAAGDGAPARRARDLLRHVPRTRLVLTSERHVPHDSWRDIMLRPQFFSSRIDWVFEGDVFVLAVEVKTRARTGFGEQQLNRYRRALTSLGRRFEYAGVLALTPTAPFKDELLARRKRFYVGSILWEEAASALRAVPSISTERGAAWQTLLDAVLPT